MTLLHVLPSTPVGAVTLEASALGIRSLRFAMLAQSVLTEDVHVLTEDVLTEDGTMRAKHHLHTATNLLTTFFRGEPVDVRGLLIDWTGQSPFSQAVLRTLLQVPWGDQTTYGTLAAAVGRPRGARAVGQSVGRNPIPILIPCHRVLPSSGRLGGYLGGSHRKITLLKLEGWKAEE